MKLTERQLRKLVEAAVTDLGSYRAAKTKRWTHVGSYTSTEVPGTVEVDVSNHGELGLTIGERTVILTMVDTAALLDHVRRALDRI